MTSNISAEAASESSFILEKRTEIWQQYDAACQKETELRELAKQFGKPNTTERLPDLSKSGSPPDELAEAIWAIKQESEKIRKLRQQIQTYREEIQKNNQQFLAVVGIAALLIIIILVVIFSQM